jgi:hypothetical protein
MGVRGAMASNTGKTPKVTKTSKTSKVTRSAQALRAAAGSLMDLNGRATARTVSWTSRKNVGADWHAVGRDLERAVQRAHCEGEARGSRAEREAAKSHRALREAETRAARAAERARRTGA